MKTKKEKDPNAPAKESSSDSKPVKDFVRLADQDTGFWDSESGFQIIRSQKKELTQPIGSETQKALITGRLLIVR